MELISLYYHIHQPCRIKKYRIFDMHKNIDYFDKEKNNQIIKKLSKEKYLPILNLFEELINKYIAEDKKKFKVTISISGIALEQLKNINPQIIEKIQKLVQTGSVEFLIQTYYNSYLFKLSKEEFDIQINKHKRIIQNLFNKTPIGFKNMYDVDISKENKIKINSFGYNSIIKHQDSKNTHLNSNSDLFVDNCIYLEKSQLKEIIKKIIDIDPLFLENNINFNKIDFYKNQLQSSAIRELFQLEKKVKLTNDVELLENWRKLSSIDHFIYMSDDENLNSLNIHQNQFYSYSYYMNCLNDLKKLVAKKLEKKNYQLKLLSKKNISDVSNNNLNSIKKISLN